MTDPVCARCARRSASRLRTSRAATRSSARRPSRWRAAVIDAERWAARRAGVRESRRLGRGFVTVRGPPARRARPSVAAMLATARTFSLIGVEAREVRVEVDVRTGLPAFALVGLPDAAVRESRERVRAALVQLRLRLPAEADHGEPRSGRPAQGGPGIRPRDRGGGARRLGAARRRGPRRTRRSPASSPSTARFARCRASLAMAEAARAPRRARSSCPARSRPEAALVGGLRVIPVDRLEQLRALGTDAEPAQPEPLALGLDELERRVARPRATCAASPALRARARDRRRRRATASDGRPARRGQVDGGAPAAVDPAAARPAEAVEAMRVASACGPAARAARLPGAAVSRAAPHGLDRRPDRRRDARRARAR